MQRACRLVCCLAVSPVGAWLLGRATLPGRAVAAAGVPALRLRGGAVDIRRAFASSSTRSAMPSVTPTSASVDAMKCLGNWFGPEDPSPAGMLRRVHVCVVLGENVEVNDASLPCAQVRAGRRAHAL